MRTAKFLCFSLSALIQKTRAGEPIESAGFRAFAKAALWTNAATQSQWDSRDLLATGYPSGIQENAIYENGYLLVFLNSNVITTFCTYTTEILSSNQFLFHPAPKNSRKLATCAQIVQLLDPRKRLVITQVACSQSFAITPLSTPVQQGKCSKFVSPASFGAGNFPKSETVSPAQTLASPGLQARRAFSPVV